MRFGPKAARQPLTRPRHHLGGDNVRGAKKGRPTGRRPGSSSSEGALRDESHEGLRSPHRHSPETSARAGRPSSRRRRRSRALAPLAATRVWVPRCQLETPSAGAARSRAPRDTDMGTTRSSKPNSRSTICPRTRRSVPVAVRTTSAWERRPPIRSTGRCASCTGARPTRAAVVAAPRGDRRPRPAQGDPKGTVHRRVPRPPAHLHLTGGYRPSAPEYLGISKRSFSFRSPAASVSPVLAVWTGPCESAPVMLAPPTSERFRRGLLGVLP